MLHLAAMRLAVAVLLLTACKGHDKAEPAKESAPAARAEVKPAEPLPSHFPLPVSPTRTLVRSSSRLTMAVWEYEYKDLAAADATKQIESGMTTAGYQPAAQPLTGSKDGHTYAVTVRAHDGVTSVAIRAFPEAGPTTLAAPPTYPSSFPFLAGGTASNAPDGGRLRIAYQSDPSDIETAMVLAATSAGWQCTGTGNVRCAKDKASVSFMTEPAPSGSVLIVSVR